MHDGRHPLGHGDPGYGSSQWAAGAASGLAGQSFWNREESA